MEKKKNKISEKLFLVIPIFAGLLFAGIFNIWFKYTMVSGNSMNDTLKDGQSVLVKKRTEIKNGDIIVCDGNDLERILIKRVIASEGDTIDINFETHVVSVNGVPLNEPYIKEPTEESESNYDYPVTVPKDCYFVMGDNRNHSIDSRDERVGFVNKRTVIGKVIYY